MKEDKKKKTNLYYLSVAISVLVVAITVISLGGYNAESEISSLSYHIAQVKSAPYSGGRVAGVQTEQAKITVFREGKNSISLDFQIKPNTTVLDALKDLAKAYGLELKTKQYDFGIMVEGIGDQIGGQNGKYWAYYVNGEMAMNSVDKQVVKPGDKIEFKFESSNF